MDDSLGDRIKRYERASSHHLTPRTPVIVRVDGRAFHTYTRHLHKPFDHALMRAMQYATVETAKEMQGFKLAYTQSDEASFLLHDFDKLDSQPWFGYDHSKVVSLAASLFTATFNRMRVSQGYATIATFDARAFNVPADDVPNVFVWRQRDWERNSLQMLARSRFSHKQMDGKGCVQLQEMLREVGSDWDDLDEAEKHGMFVLPDSNLVSNRAVKAKYSDIQAMIEPF